VEVPCRSNVCANFANFKLSEQHMSRLSSRIAEKYGYKSYYEITVSSSPISTALTTIFLVGRESRLFSER
jgi:hypothetical protein